MTLIERLRHHAAHPAYHPYGPVFTEAAEAIRDRDAEIERLRKDAARYRWLKSREALELTSYRGGAVWSRPDGSKFTATHYLAEGGVQHAPAESLDEAIDKAMRDE